MALIDNNLAKMQKIMPRWTNPWSYVVEVKNISASKY